VIVAGFALSNLTSPLRAQQRHGSVARWVEGCGIDGDVTWKLTARRCDARRRHARVVSRLSTAARVPSVPTSRILDMGRDNRQRRAANGRDRARFGRPADGSPPPPPDAGWSFDDLSDATDAFSAPPPRASPHRPPAPARESDPGVIMEQLRRLIDEASIVSTRSPEDASIAVDTLRVLSARAPGPEHDPAPMVVRDVIASLAQCWERGWQPLDVEHVLRRQSTAKAATWVTQVILAEAAQSRASERAPQEWCGQLDALIGEVGRVLPAGDLLRAAGLASDADWTAALTVLGWLRTLPGTQVLMPRPSSWDRIDRSGGRSRAARSLAPSSASDPKLLTRIRALLAKAEATDFPAEAEALTAKAQDLMTRHAIDEALVHAQAGDSITVIGRRIHIDNPYALEKAILLNGVAGANRVKAAWSDFAASMTLVGVPTDIDQVEMLFTSLLIQGTRAMTEAGEASHVHGVNRSSSFRRSFLIAYATRIGQRLDTATDEAAAAYGSALVPVFARQEAAVGEEYDRLFPHVKSSVVGRNLNRRGWEAGTDAADRAVMTAGQVGA
jgi:hypothetical protein